MGSPGYWGVPTSDMDFCEPNYETSHYVAEFWNTVSSIPVVLTGLSGIVLCRMQKLGAEQMLCYGLIATIGLGSVAFHATLLRTGQVLDECPMLWATLSLVYCAYHHRHDRRLRHGVEGKASARLALIGGALGTYGVTATLLYFTSGFSFFIVAYAASVVVLVILAASILFAERPAVGAEPKKLLTIAACTYGGGVLLLWLPGELLCHHVPLFQRVPMHAFFHLTSAAGPHLGLTAFALARFDTEQHTAARSSLQFAGLPAIDRGGWQAVRKVV